MTEQEIIEYLKENRLIGVAFKFIPSEVKEWVIENYKNLKLLYLTAGGRWGFSHQTDFSDYANLVFALNDDYELPKEPSGEWVVFEIDKDGEYHLCSDEHYHWSEWNNTLRENYCNSSFRLTAFGGWQYDDGGCWHTCPTFKHSDEGDKPAIPIRIRFWRENK